MNDLSTLRTALGSSFSAIEDLTSTLGAAEWPAQSLCPAWTVRDVVSHLASVEVVLSGWLPDGVDVPPPFERAGSFVASTTGLDAASFARTVHEVFDGRRRDLDGLCEADLQRPSWTPTGPSTYGRFLAVRVFDFWVHERDITTPLDRSTDDGGLTAELAVHEVELSLGYIVGKKIGLPDGRSIVFHLTGPVHRDLCVVVDGRARVVDEVERPDVEVTTDSLTFVQLACGRIDPQGPIGTGAIRWTGDADYGERAARNLRYTM